mmetsp:Transcript_50984/g.153275  ORF Transcript_50984/g.153275 Transcript_50984/m.153275 type:complete len:234 (+) Transcript_50984:53-754(+)
MTASTTSTEGGGKQRRTELKHLTYSGNFELKCTATVLACRLCSPSDEDATASAEQSVTKVEMNLDVTTMHPQGGGQPTDIGNIFSEGGAARAIIDRVSLDRETGVVTHHGRVESTTGGDLSENFSPGDSVSVAVDPSRRLVLSECHTAGHVVDSAMARCGRILPPTKVRSSWYGHSFWQVLSRSLYDFFSYSVFFRAGLSFFGRTLCRIQRVNPAGRKRKSSYRFAGCISGSC